MKNLLIYLIKLGRDAGFADKDIADLLHYASVEVRAGRFWPTDIVRQP